MKFGIFYELSVPRPWTRESERDVYMNALEQVRLADELGFDQVWCVEHHFLREYSHTRAPVPVLPALPVHTETIHVGRALAGSAPPPIWSACNISAASAARAPERSRSSRMVTSAATARAVR